MGLNRVLGVEHPGRPMSEQNIFALCDQIRQTAYDARLYLGTGHFEKIYENSLANRLRNQGLQVVQQHPLSVYDEDGTLLGDFSADLFVEGVLIVELKACRALAPEHEAQILGYLRASRIRDGMLINFCGPKFEARKFIL